ncbi:hypothetical protein FB451DRAFT_1173150 [Mycena latifolia]|nr:hypothetical protein FB451DRAFT_1173150 [Mycena latifolia]
MSAPLCRWPGQILSPIGLLFPRQSRHCGIHTGYGISDGIFSSSSFWATGRSNHQGPTYNRAGCCNRNNTGYQTGDKTERKAGMRGYRANAENGAGGALLGDGWGVLEADAGVRRRLVHGLLASAGMLVSGGLSAASSRARIGAEPALTVSASVASATSASSSSERRITSRTVVYSRSPVLARFGGVPRAPPRAHRAPARQRSICAPRPTRSATARTTFVDACLPSLRRGTEQSAAGVQYKAHNMGGSESITQANVEQLLGVGRQAPLAIDVCSPIPDWSDFNDSVAPRRSAAGEFELQDSRKQSNLTHQGRPHPQDSMSVGGKVDLKQVVSWSREGLSLGQKLRVPSQGYDNGASSRINRNLA